MMNKTLVAVVISAAFSGSAYASCNNGSSFNQNYRECVDRGIATAQSTASHAVKVADLAADQAHVTAVRNAALESKVAGIEGSLNSVVADIGGIADDINGNNGIKHRVEELEKGVTGVKEDIAGVAGNLDKTNGRLDVVDAKVDGAMGTATAAGTAAANAQGTADKAVTAAAGAQAQADANKQVLGQLNPKVDELVNISSKLAVTAASHDSRLSTVEGDIAKTNTRLDVVDRKVDGAMGTAQEALNTANANSAAIKDTNIRVDAVEQVANAAVNDAAKAQTTADRAESKADAAQGTADKAVKDAAAAQSTANRAEAKADMNTASIGKVSERVDLVEQDVSSIRHDVDTNTQAIYAHGNALKQHGETLKAHGDRLDNHDKRIGSLEQQMNGFKSDLADLQDEVKAVGAMSMAAANLHYVGVENSYAMSMGQYRSATALAAGAQFNVNEKTAVTVQLATDFTGSLGGAVGVHGRW